MTRHTALAVGLGLGLAAPSVLHGQTPDTTARRDTVILAPVAVSAARIAGPLASAPFAATVRSTAALPKGTTALALDDVLRGMPGVQVDNRFNYALGERISVRGAGARAQFGVRGIRVLVDGIPATLPDGQTALNQVDLATVTGATLLRGPVASLFGNAAGGAILLETAPAPDGLEVSATAGTHELLRTRAAAGGGRGSVRYAATVSRVAYGGYRTHSDAENLYGAVRLTWVGARDLLRVSAAVVDYDARNPGSLNDSLVRVARHEAFRNNVANRTGERGTQRQVGSQWRRAVGDDELELTAWTIGRELENPIPARIVALERLAGGIRALYRGNAARLHWTAGVEREAQRDDRQNYGNQAGERGELVLDQLERVTGTGAFAQAQAQLAPRLAVLAGVRYDRTSFEADDRFVQGADPDDSGRRVMSAASPSVGVTLRLRGDAVLYANAGTAFETPTTTELANRPDGAGGFNPVLEPQRTVTYEVGGRRATERVVAEVAAFRAHVRDALIPFEVEDVPSRQYFRNAGRTITGGIEAAISLRPSLRWRIDAAHTFTRARFGEYTLAGTSYRGNAVPGIAPHRTELAVTRSGRGGWVAADVRHQSRMAVDDANTASSPAHVLADLRAGLERRAVTLFAGVQNVFGARYNASVVVNAFGRRYFEPGPLRTFHVGGSVRAR